MVCDVSKIKEITYQDFDNKSNSLTYNCELKPLDIKYYNKYIKYKKKYLLLSSK